MLSKLISEYKSRVQLRTETINNLPKFYQIEPTNYCNLKCPACPSLYIKEKPKYLKLEEFIYIANQIPKGSAVLLYHFGEPFLNPDIFEIINEGKKRDFYLTIHSNLCINSNLIPKIIESGLDELSASIDGATKETYDLYRLDGDFQLAVSNFKELVKLRKEKNVNIKLKYQIVLNQYNEKEIDKLKELLSSMPEKVDFAFVPMAFREDNPDWDNLTKSELEETKKYWLPKNKSNLMRRYKSKNIKALIEETRCPHLWETLSINVYGEVTPCCYTYKKEHSFGNIFETPLIDIWNNEKYRQSRRLFLDNQYNRCLTVCDKCDNYIKSGNKGILKSNYLFIKWLTNKIFEKYRALNPSK